MYRTLLTTFVCSTLLCGMSQAAPAQPPMTDETQAIDWVWAGQRVWFDYVSQGKHQMIAYYDASRQMSIAAREMGDVNGGPWIYHKVPSYLGWDAHNKVAAAFDKNGYIHVVGNIHANPLVYFRSTEPYNPRTLQQVKVMVNPADEQSMTYPEFFVDSNDELYFKYRVGTSNRGKWYYNAWNTEKQQWSHLHSSTILDGEGVRSVYPLGPIFGPDGYAHLVYVWRENPKASSNHDLSYARSKDLIHWEDSSGKAIDLPIITSTAEVIDPIPMHGGLLNGRTPIGFDSNNRVMVTYQKYDADGNSQVYLVRREPSGWKVVQISNWKDSRVDLHKGGALDLPLDTSEPAYVREDGKIVVPAFWKGQHWQWLLDHITLQVLSGGPIDNPLPATIAGYDLDNGIPLRVLPLKVEQKAESEQFYISWEAMQPNRDQARPDIPQPSTLRMHRIVKK